MTGASPPLLPCQRESPRLWFSDLPADLELAKTYCRPCPQRGPCLAGAVERAEPCGVWGGEILEQGLITASKRPRGRPPKQAEKAVHPVILQQPATAHVKADRGRRPGR